MPVYRCDYDDDSYDDSGDDDFFDESDEEEEDEDVYEDEDEEDDEGDLDDDNEDQQDLSSNGDDDDEQDYEEDYGDWTAEDYQESAEQLFGDNPHFGETIVDQLAEEGYQPFEDSAFAEGFERIAPGSSETVNLFERDGQLHAFGFIPAAMMALLRSQYSGIDFSNLRASVPLKGELAEPKPLPAAYAEVQPPAAVDLRPACTPVGDQGDTSRCSAFAWTHAIEMTRSLEKLPSPRLSPSYTMLQFQRMQGDAQDYTYAYEGGSGTVSGPDPGEVLMERGTCRQELWPDQAEEPRVHEREMAQDASQFKLQARPHPIALDDVKKVLAAGSPVHVGMNTGPMFMEVGRDGVISASEPPSGRHGRHAMLMVGYKENYYIVKNSWGEQWGDQGYCYLPKNVVAEGDPEFIAVLRPKPA